MDTQTDSERLKHLVLCIIGSMCCGGLLYSAWVTLSVWGPILASLPVGQPPALMLYPIAWLIHVGGTVALMASMLWMVTETLQAFVQFIGNFQARRHDGKNNSEAENE